jgi:serine/threonine protein kinase
LLFNIGVYHRDIKPDNLYVYLKKQPNNKYIPTLLFLDFGGSIHDRITAEDTTDSANIGYSKNKHAFSGTIIYTHSQLIELYKRYNKIWYHDIFDEYSLYKSWKIIINAIKHEIYMYNNIKLFSANIQPQKLKYLYDTIYKNIENKLHIIDNQIKKYANYIIRTMTGGKRRLNKTYKNLKNTHNTYKNKRK